MAAYRLSNTLLPTMTSPHDSDSALNPSTDTESDAGVDASTRADTADEELPLDETFHVLQNSRRRETLRYLSSHEGECSLGTLAEWIAARENDTTPDALSSDQRKRVYVALYQSHLPKMDDSGVISYDQSRGSVTLTQRGRRLLQYLERAEPPAERFRRLFVGGSAGAVLLAVVTLALPSLGVAGLSAVLFGLGLGLALAWALLLLAGDNADVAVD